MSAVKHSPSPWRTAPYADDYLIEDAAQHLLATVNGLRPEGLTNARIMAAAPTLLAALKRARDTIYTGAPGNTWAETLDEINTAITVATGETE